MFVIAEGRMGSLYSREMEQKKKQMPRDKWILIYFGCSWMKDPINCVRLLGQQGVPSWRRATKL